jgi:acid phosphatase family membrane protein YuiD
MTITVRTQTFLHATGQLAHTARMTATVAAFVQAHGFDAEAAKTFANGGTIVVNDDSDVRQQSCIVEGGAA